MPTVLAFVNEEDSKDKEELFLKLQEYLLSDDAQRQIVETDGARRSTRFRRSRKKSLPDGNPIDDSAVADRLSKAEVIRQALDMYQTGLRSRRLRCTVWTIRKYARRRFRANASRTGAVARRTVRKAKSAARHGGRSQSVHSFDSDVRALYEAHGNGAELEKSTPY